VLLGNAPRHMAAIADAPQQIQAPRGRSRSRTKATAGAGPELKEALDEADKKLGPKTFRMDSPEETPQMRPASAKPRGRPRKKPEPETPQIAVVPFERSASKGEKEEIPQMVVRAPRVRSRSKHDETPQMPKAKARAKSRAKLPETPYVGPSVPLNPAAEALGGDEVPQFVALPTAPAKRIRKKKALGLEAAAPTIVKKKLKVEAPVGEKRGRGRPRKVQIVEP